MAWLFPYLNHGISPTTAYVFVMMGFISVTSVVAFLCSSHGQEEYRRGDGSGKRLSRFISSKALLVARMVSWRKVAADEVEEEDGGEESDEEELWRKTIIRGEKCQPLDFSGRILYDSNGKPLP